jgi:glycosyltransferase involved in cell wall biosynthesis
MKIHFENVDVSSTSGPNSFAGRLLAELTSKGHEIVDTYKQSDVTCVFIQANSQIPQNHPTVLRLDGIWFKPEQFDSHNVQIKKSYLESHSIVWQSEFDKKMTEKYWGSRPGSIIGNGINIKKVEIQDSQIKRLRESYEHIFVCSANWHPQKRLKENIEAFLRIRQQLIGSSALVIMGKSPDVHVQNPDIYFTGSISHKNCLEMFAASDWMLHLAWLDHCPNTVVEALSQDCPVICTNSGGTHEIVKSNGIVIPENNDYNFELTDYDKPYSIDLNVLEGIDWSTKPVVDNSYLDISKVTSKYLKEFKSAIERRL